MFEVRCEQCQSPFDVDERRVPRGGMQMRCPKCNASLLVKRPVAAPPPTPPSTNPRGTLAFSGVDTPLPTPARQGARPPPPPRGDVGLPALKGTPAAGLPARMGDHAALPALMDDIGLPLPMDDNAALPLPMDDNAALPLPKEFAPPAAPKPVGDLPMPFTGRADLPQVMDASVGLPMSLDFDAALPNPMESSAALPSPMGGGADLPVVRDFDFDLPSLTAPLPAPSGTNLPTPSAALPTPREVAPTQRPITPAPSQGLAASRPQGAPQPTIAVVGAPRPAPPMEFDLPGEPILFDADEADLPLAADNLPMSVDFPVLAENLPTSVDLPQSTEALPSASDPTHFGPEIPGLEPDPLPPIVTSPTMQAKEGAKLGRIGLERKAFTVNDDLPAVSPGAALPAPSTRGRRRIEEEVKPAARRNPAASPYVIDSVPPPEEVREVRPAPAPFAATAAAPQGGGFGDLDLGPMSLDSAPPSFGYAQPSAPPMPPGLMAPPSPQFISGPPVAPSLPPLDNPFDPGIQSIAPPPGGSMQPAPIVDDILGSFDSGASMPPMSSPEFEPPMKAPEPVEKSGGRFGKKTGLDLGVAVDNPARRKRMMFALYGALGVLGVAIIGGAALALTPYGAFGKNWIDDALHGDERLAAANRVIQEVERILEQDTYERAVAGLRRLDQAVVRVPQVKDLQAYVVYANNLVAARFGPEPARIGRARQVLATLTEAPPGTRYLNLARASDALLRGNAREALRMAKLDPAGRDLATLAAERVGDQEQLLRLAREGRQRHPSPRSRYLLARAAAAKTDHETARQEAEAVLRAEPRHAGARVLLARLLTRQDSERDRAVELLRDLVGGGRGGQGANPTGASVSERAEACVVSGQVEFLRDHVTAAQARFQRALELDPRSASALVGIGQILSRQGNFSDAVARFRNALSADRNNLDAVIGIAQASLALGQAGDARQAIEPAIRDNPTDGRLHYWLGRSLAATSDQRTVAQQSFREAIRLQPASLDAYVALSEMLLSMQRADQADQVLMEARARVPESSAIHRALAHSRLVRGDLAGAEGELRVALQRDARDIRAHFALGDVLRRMQRLDDAQHEFEAVAEMDASYPGLAMARGQLAEARGELPQALQTFREALARDPTNVELIVRVATTLVSLGNFGDADQMLRSVVVDHSSNADAQYTMGRARLGEDNYVDAVHYLDRAIELNPSKADYKAYAAEAHRRAGDIQRALQLAEQSIELDPSFPRGYWVRAEIRLHRGDASDALGDINRATQLDPRFWAAFATWADIDDALGRRAEAIRLYRFAIERDNRHGDWHYNLGRLLADSGDEGAARAAFLQARAIGNGVAPVPSWFVQATRALADIERERHNRGEAQRLYTEYLRFVPSGSAAYNSAALALSDMLHE
jgi:predicted Zn finger-like uncharacterized protein